MKTAILFSGQARFVKQNYDNFCENVLKKFPDSDIFIYTWSHDKDIISSDGNIYPDDATPEELFELYNPKYMRVEPLTDNWHEIFKKVSLSYAKHIDTNSYNAMAMYFSWIGVRNLFNPNDYDFVIKYRFETNIKFGEIIPGPELTIPVGGNFYNGINDAIAYGAPWAIYKYLSLIDNFDECYDIVGAIHPEALNRANLINIHGLHPYRSNLIFTIRDKEYNIIHEKEYYDYIPWPYDPIMLNF